MKFTCDRSVLAEIISTVGGVIPSRTPKPILQNVLIEVYDDGHAEICATDTEVAIRVAVDVQHHEQGVVCIPHKRLSDILRESGGETVSLSARENERLLVTCGGAKFQMGTTDPLEFPNVPVFDAKDCWNAPCGMLVKAIQRAKIGMAEADGVLATACMLFEFDKLSGTLHLVCTSSGGMAHTEVPVAATGDPADKNVPKRDDEKPRDNLITGKVIGMLTRILPKDDGEAAEISVSDGYLMRVGKTVLFARMAEGKFQTWRKPLERIAKATPVGTMTIVAGPILAAVKQARLATDVERQAGKFSFSEGLLTIRTSSAENGSAEVEVPIAWSGEATELEYDCQGWLSPLAIVDSESQFEASCYGDTGPMALRLTAGGTFDVLFMPLGDE